MIIALKELGKIITGNTPSKKESKYWNSNDICFVKPDVISEQEISYLNGSNEYLSENARTKARIVTNDSILVTCIGSIGKIGVVCSGEYAFNQQINAIVPNNMVLPKYLAYCLLYAKPRLIELANTAVVPIINKSQFGNFEIKIDVNKNREFEIVNTLDLIRKIISLRRRQLDLLDKLVKARFVEMFGYEKKMYPMSEVCSIITDGTHQPPKFVSEGIPFIFVSNITNNIITYNTEKFISQDTYNELIRRTPIEIGDLLLSTVGSYGHPAVVKSNKKFLFQRHIAYLKPKLNIINSDFLHGAILSPNVQRQIEDVVKGIAQKTLNLSEIRQISIPLPPLSLQQSFASFVSCVERQKSRVRSALEESQLLFDSMMQRYFG